MDTQNLNAQKNTPQVVKSSGLEGVIVANTALSHVDGERGELIVAGFSVEQFAKLSSFETGMVALWNAAGLVNEDRLGSLNAQAEQLTRQLGAARERAFQFLAPYADDLETRAPMDGLRAMVGLLSSSATEIDLVAAVHVATALIGAKRAKQPICAPDSTLDSATDLLRMLGGGHTPPLHISAALQRYWLTVIDHGMNASTFVARTVTSTNSDSCSAVVAAIGALKGPLHGGAPGPVLDMLDQISRPALAEPWLRAELAAGKRIMGMGHRIYRVRDPRAEVLEIAIRDLARIESPNRVSRQDNDSAGLGSSRVAERLAIARAVEKSAETILAERNPNRVLKANVEFYTAVLLEAIGFHRDLLSNVFACGRIAGWCAHIAEQRKSARIIRPDSHYVGKWPEKTRNS